MKPDDDQRLKHREIDKRKVAAHEAGHVVVAAMLYGKNCDASINFQESHEEWVTEWVGRTFLDHFGAPPVSVAGVCAEEFDTNRRIDIEEILESYRQGELEFSRTDMLHLSGDVEEIEEAFDSALSVLQGNEAFFDFVRDALLNKMSIGAHEIDEYRRYND